MKKLAMCLMVALLSLTFIPTQSRAAEGTPASIVLTKADEATEAKAKVLLGRLNEIKEMDKSNLSSSEKKNLRKEVRLIRQQLRKGDEGIYYAAGTVVVVILLLIILL